MSAIAALLGLTLAQTFLTFVGLVAAIVGTVLLRYLSIGRALAGINARDGTF